MKQSAVAASKGETRTGDIGALSRMWWRGFRAARSGAGYSVNLLGLKHGLEYREGERAMEIHVETAGVEEVDWSIYTSSIERWLPPHEQEILAEEKRAQIRQRVLAALDFLAIKYRIAE